MKRPAFQFYPADWRKDSALQSCSLAAQGLWVNLMCVMHECEPYGYLTVNRKPLEPARIARLVGLPLPECEALLQELDAAGVFSKTRSGVIYSRRMVKDERIRNARASAGKLGGNPRLVNHEDNQQDNHTPKQNPTPSSSSSSSTSVGTKEGGRQVATSPASELSRALLSLGCNNGHSANPHVQQWAKEGVTPEQITEAMRIATQERGKDRPPTAYLVPIVTDLRNPKPERMSKQAALEERNRRVSDNWKPPELRGASNAG